MGFTTVPNTDFTDISEYYRPQFDTDNKYNMMINVQNVTGKQASSKF